jgi:predicted permease
MSSHNKISLHPSEKKTLSIFLLITYSLLLVLILFILLVKIGKTEGVDSACIFVSFISNTLLFLFLLVRGCSKKTSIVTALVFQFIMISIIISYTTYHHNSHLVKNKTTKGVIVNVERTRFGFGYIVAFEVENKTYYSYTVHPKLFNQTQLKDSVLIHYAVQYPIYNYVTLISSNKSEIH